MLTKDKKVEKIYIDKSEEFNYTNPGVTYERNSTFGNPKSDESEMMKVFALDEKSPFVELLKNKSSNQGEFSTNIEFKNENWVAL